MKKFRKLIPAFVLLLISTAIMSTATFAWFSMNQRVTATGMSVTAKSDQIFLMIDEGHAADAATVRTANQTSATAVIDSAALLPAAHDLDSSATLATVEALSGAVMANWYWMTSNDPAVATGTSGKLTIESSALANYVLINEFSITVAEGSNNVANLRVENVTITTDGDAAVKVLVVGSDASEEFGVTSGSSGTLPGSNPLRATDLTKNDVAYVKVYIYWDGNDADVYTNGIEDLKNTSVVVTFTGDVVPAA